jgi:NACalpha-BTF3-like transcription factor
MIVDRGRTAKPRRAHDPLVCGLFPDLDCDLCQAAAEANRDVEAQRREAEERRQLSLPDVERLVQAISAHPDTVRSALMELLGDDLADAIGAAVRRATSRGAA